MAFMYRFLLHYSVYSMAMKIAANESITHIFRHYLSKDVT